MEMQYIQYHSMDEAELANENEKLLLGSASPTDWFELRTKQNWERQKVKGASCRLRILHLKIYLEFCLLSLEFSKLVAVLKSLRFRSWFLIFVRYWTAWNFLVVSRVSSTMLCLILSVKCRMPQPKVRYGKSVDTNQVHSTVRYIFSGQIQAFAWKGVGWTCSISHARRSNAIRSSLSQEQTTTCPIPTSAPTRALMSNRAAETTFELHLSRMFRLRTADVTQSHRHRLSRRRENKWTEVGFG